MSKGIKLPINIQFTDKVELVQKFCGIYSTLVKHLTKRDIDLITMCYLYDINKKDFLQKVVDSKIGINSTQNVTTMLSRLKSKKLIVKDPVKSIKTLSPDLQAFLDLAKYELIQLELNFKKEQ